MIPTGVLGDFVSAYSGRLDWHDVKTGLHSLQRLGWGGLADRTKLGF